MDVAMAHRRGRYLGVVLDDDIEKTSSCLQALGLADTRALEVASAAILYAREEEAQLIRQLMPRGNWPGHVCLRRHVARPRDESWLMLRFDGQNRWTLDAVFVI